MPLDMNSFEKLAFEREGRILTILLNDPERLNCVAKAMHDDLCRVFIEVADDPETDIVVLAGAGKAFSAGGDVAHMKRTTDEPHLFYPAMVEAKRLVHSMLDCPQPIICQLNGDAMGLGATIALLCDTIFASETARIADPHVRFGYVAGDGGAVIWPQLVGSLRARMHLLSGDALTGVEAAALGLVNFTAPADELEDQVRKFALRLSMAPQATLRRRKALMNTPLKEIATAALETGLAYEGLSNTTLDHIESVNAFLEKRRPVFTGH